MIPTTPGPSVSLRRICPLLVLLAVAATLQQANAFLITNVTATASSEISQPPFFRYASNALNGITLDSYFWESIGVGDGFGEDRAPAITFDLQQAFPVDYLLIWNSHEPGPAIKSVAVEVSTDGLNFQPASQFSLNGLNDPPQQLGLDGVLARYVRLNILENYAGSVFPLVGNPVASGLVAIDEVEFYSRGFFDVLLYGIAKEHAYVQSGAGPPVLDNNPYSIHAFVVDRNLFQNNAALDVRVDAPLGSSLTLAPSAVGSVIDGEARVSFSSQELLDANYPNGSYLFNFQPGEVSGMNGDTYPVAPHVSNFAEAQSINPGADFVLKWDPFPGSNVISVRIYNGSVPVLETGFPIGGDSALDLQPGSLLIPAYTLQPGTSYRAEVRFESVVAIDAQNPTAGTGFGSYESVTRFNLQTGELRRSPSAIIPLSVSTTNEVAYDLAFGGGDYLVAMLGRQLPLAINSSNREIVATLVGRDGTTLRTIDTGDYGTAPAVAYGRTNFLLVWSSETYFHILGLLVGNDGSYGPFIISQRQGVEQPDVAFDGTNFLVTWTAQDLNGDYTLPRARLVNPDDVFTGAEIDLPSGALDVNVAAGGGRFLAVAVDSDTESGVYGQLLDGSGALVGSVINIDTSPAPSGGPKEVFFDEAQQRFIVTFQDGDAAAGASDIFARTVGLDGSVGPRKTIASGAGAQVGARIASDGHSLLFTWNDGFLSPTVMIHSRFFDGDLNPLGADTVAFLQHSNKVPFLAPLQFDGSRFLIVNSAVQVLTDTNGDRDYVNGDAYGRFVMPNAPGIATQPRDQIVAPGANVTFSVQATGPQPLSYQWQRNGANIPGATNAQLALAAVSFADATAFRVLVSNEFGTTASRAAQLTVLQPPAIAVQPESRLSVGAGESVTFNVVVSGDGPFSYQWRMNGINVTGATNASLAVQAAVATQGSYSVAVANPVAAINSDEASLTLQGPALDFRDNFADRNILAGGEAAGGFGGGASTGATREPSEPLHAGKAGGASVWYGWRAPDNGVVVFTTSGSGFDTLLAIYTGSSIDQLTPVVSDDDSGGGFTSSVTFNAVAGTEYILAVDGLGGQTGNIFLAWSFEVTAKTAPMIIASPRSQTVNPGSTISLEVSVQSDSAATFQWFKDNEPLAGKTSNPLVIDLAQLSDVGSYAVRVGNASGFSALSAPAFIELGASPALTTSDKFEDARANRVVLPAADGFAAPSAGSIVTQNRSASKERGEPNHGGVIGGASRWFVVQPSADGVLAIDTMGSDFDTVLAVYTGASLATLQLVAQDDNSAADGLRSAVRFNASSGVDYYVAVDGALGVQGTIVLNYQFGAPPRILEAPVGRSVIAGNDFALRVIAAADINLSYLWKLNGVPILGATNAELLIANCQTSDRGTYSVEVATPLGTTARAVTVNILDSKTLPSVVLTAPAPTAFLVAPTNIQLSADVVAYNAAKVEFFVNGKKLGESTSEPYALNWPIAKAGKYTVTAKVTDGNRRAAKSPPVKVTVLQPVTILRQPLPLAVVPGKTARFTVVAKGSRPLSYQWLFEGAPITNAMKSVLTVPNVQPDRLGRYSVRVTNPVGSVESNPAALTFK